MSSIVVLGTLIVALPLIYAGVLKLRTREQFATAVVDIGLPTWSAQPLALVVPMIEVVGGLALVVFGNVAWLAGVLATLFIAFTGVLLMAARRSVPCSCFGETRLAQAPGAAQFARNGVLAAIAIFLALAPTRTTLSRWLAERSGEELFALALALVAFASAAFALASARGALVLTAQVGEDVERLRAGDPKRPSWFGDGLAVGTAAPAMPIQSLASGQRLDLDDPTDPRRKLVLFVGSECPACRDIAGALGLWADVASRSVAVVEVYRAGQRLGVPGAEFEVSDANGEWFRAFQVRGTPSALIVDGSGRIATSTARGRTSIEELVSLVGEEIGIA